MRPLPWRPPVELSAAEQTIVKRIRRARLFVLLREWRHEPAVHRSKLGRSTVSVMPSSSTRSSPTTNGMPSR